MVTEKQTGSRPITSTRSRKPAKSAKAVRSIHHLRVQRISLPSLVRVSFIFYVGLVVVGLIATIVGWSVLGSMGLIIKINHLIDQLVGTTNYSLSLTQVLVIQLGIGFVWAIVTTIVTFIGGALYNLASEIGNGIGVGVLDDSK